MKIYTVLLLIFFAAFAENLNAQDQTFGVEIGGFYNVQKLSALFPEYAESGFGYSVSVVGLRHEEFTEKLNLTFGVGYKMLQYQVRDYAISLGDFFINPTEFDWFNEYTEDRSKLHFLALSASTKINLNQSKVKIYIAPRVEINQFLGRSAISFSQTANGGGYLNFGNSASDFMLNKPIETQLLIGGGLGLDFPLKNQILFFEIRGKFSLSKLYQQTDETGFLKTTINARIIPIGLVTGINF